MYLGYLTFPCNALQYVTLTSNYTLQVFFEMLLYLVHYTVAHGHLELPVLLS